MSEYKDMKLLLRYAREEVERAEVILNEGDKYSSDEFRAYVKYSIESLKAVVQMSLKEGGEKKK